MAINDVLGLTVDVTAKTDGFVKALQNAAKGAKISLDVAGPMVERFKKAQGEIKGIFTKTVEDAATAGLGRAKLDKFVSKLQPLTDNIEASMKRIFRMEMASKKQGLSQEKQARIKALVAEEQQKLRGLQARLKVENQAATKIIKRRQEAVQEAERLAARSFSEAAEDAGESLQKAFEDIKAGNAAGLAKGMGKRVGAWGAGLQGKGQAKGGMMGGLMQGIGGLLSKLGPALAAIGALAAGFAAVVAMVIQADAAAKEFHRTLLENGTSALDLVDKYGNVTGSLGTLRDAFTGFQFNTQWGTTSKDHIAILNAYAKSGRTFKEITGNITEARQQMELLRDATVGALAYGKLIGESAETMAEAIGLMMEEMAVSQAGALQNFSKISKAAMDSGFSTKRFFNMVLQATTGMSMYNVRIEETIGLMLKLVKILGAQVGAEFLNKLNRGFKDESTVDRTQHAMGMGAKGGQIASLESKRQAEAFHDLLVAFQKDSAEKKTTTGAAFTKALADSGLSEALMKDPAKFSAALGKMSEKDSDALYAKLLAANSELASKFRATWQASMGNKGDVAGVQTAMEQFGASATLLAKMYKLRAVGISRVDKVSYKDIVGRVATEGPGGISSEDFRQIKQVTAGLKGLQTNLEETQKAMKARPEEAANLAKQFNEQFKDLYEVQLTEKGTLMSTRTNDVVGTDFDSLWMNWSSKVEAMTDPADDVKADIELAQVIADNTTDMAKILETGVEAMLMKIYTVVSAIRSWISGGLDDTEKKAQIKLMGQAGAGMEKMYQQLADSRARAADAMGEIRDPKTSPERKKELRETLKTEKAEQIRIRERFKDTTKFQKAVQELDEGYGWFGSYTEDEMRAQAAHKAGLSPVSSTTDSSGVTHTQSQLTDTEKQELAVRHQKLDSQYVPLDVEAKRNIAYTLMQRSGESDSDYKSRYNKALDVEKGAISKRRHDAHAAIDETYYAEILTKNTNAALAGERRNDILQTKAQLTGDKVNLKVQTDTLMNPLTGMRDASENDAIATLFAQLVGSGVGTHTALPLAEALRSGNIGGFSEILTPELMAKIMANPAIAGRIHPKIMATHSRGVTPDLIRSSQGPAAKDFLMHIGNDGQVKFAQRIDGQDTVALASKGGGAVSQATGRAGGGGGVTIVQHNYSNMEAVQKGYRSLMAARAIG